MWRRGPPTTPLCQRDWDVSEDVDAALAAFSGESRAGTTKATYASHLKQFLRYCLAANIAPAERLQSKSIAAWLMHRAHYGFKLSTIKLGVTAVSAAAGELGLPTLTHDALIQKCLKAAARRRSSAEQQKLPVLKDLMEALLQSGDDKYASVRDNGILFTSMAGHVQDIGTADIRMEGRAMRGTGPCGPLGAEQSTFAFSAPRPRCILLVTSGCQVNLQFAWCTGLLVRQKVTISSGTTSTRFEISSHQRT